MPKKGPWLYRTVNRINTTGFILLPMIVRILKFLQGLKADFSYYKERGLTLIGLKVIKLRILSLLGVLRLERIFISTSHKCNANCVHCYEKFSNKDFGVSLTNKEVKNIIKQFRRLGGCWVFFCSGEFLLREDALDLVAYAKANNMGVSVTTNGLLLNEKKIDELKKAGLADLIVSIDSANPSKHDKLRGVEGCFQKAKDGLYLAAKKGLYTHIWTYVTKSNFNELEDIVKLGEKLGVAKVFVFFTLLSGHLFNKFEENLTYEEREAFRKRFNNKSGVLLEFESEEEMCSGGGFKHICIMPSGDATFCPPVPYSYGNIKSESLKNCLAEIVKDRKLFSHCTGQCIVNFPEYRQKCNAKFLYE